MQTKKGLNGRDYVFFIDLIIPKSPFVSIFEWKGIERTQSLKLTYGVSGLVSYCLHPFLGT